jgi:hypothetical protein
MAARGKRAALEAEAFRTNTEALCRFYAAQGLARAHKDVLEVKPLTDTLDTVRTADTLFDADGEVIAAWEHVYLVSETEAGPKVIAALPDDELDAWTVRGTPLGSW